MVSSVFLWLGMAVYLLLVLGTAIVVLLENRQPERTIAWIVALVLLPVVGLVAFYFFGRNIRRPRLLVRATRRQEGRKRVPPRQQRSTIRTAGGVSDAWRGLASLCAEGFGAQMDTATDIRIFTDGTALLQDLIEAFDEAKRSILLETYIIEDDSVGRRVADALARAAKRGVEVRLLYDDVGCWRVPTRFFRRMERAGVHTAAFLPVRFPALTHKVNYRNHRKLCIVDGTTGFIGGMNLAERYLGREDFTWRDLHLSLHGTLVARMAHVFLSDWAFVKGELGARNEDLGIGQTKSGIRNEELGIKPREYGMRNEELGIKPTATAADENQAVSSRSPIPNSSFLTPHSPSRSPIPHSSFLIPNSEAVPVQLVTNDPTTPHPQLMYAYTWAAMHARKYLYVETPYFMPTEPFLQALKTAAMSAVDVRLCLPRKPDGRTLRWINDSYITELLQAGVRVYMYDGGFLHTKCIVADDAWCAVGSANIDFRSFLNNIEVSALVYDADTAARIRLVAEADMKHSQEVDADRWARRPLRRRLLESATRIIAPLF
ncbi:MAG: PLDc N-terminal domain-containing protein [Bacteroidaceae bacterium]|nr:PLDc N-terminal domain-containing protein [Bacteroidaceae bacterium]